MEFVKDFLKIPDRAHVFFFFKDFLSLMSTRFFITYLLYSLGHVLVVMYIDNNIFMYM